MSRELADLALAVARDAAELIRGARLSTVEVAATKSSDVDVVTETDRASERLIRELISRQRPADAFLGEEGGGHDGSSGVRWIVDPIDGTVNFLYSLPQYAVSIAAEVDGEVVAGVVLNVATGTEYVGFAVPGGEAVAWRDGTPIRVREPAPLELMLVATGFSYDRRVRVHQARAVMTLLPRIRDIRRFGSCALDLCHVAEGTVDAYVEEGVNLWDYAAAAMIARAAGARTAISAGSGEMVVLTCAPAASFGAFQAAVSEAGFLGATVE